MLKNMRLAHDGETGHSPAMTASLTTHVSGYSSADGRNMLERALKEFQQGRLGASALAATARTIRHQYWQEQRQAGLSFVAVNDFSIGNAMLDLACTFGLIPDRFGGPDVPVTLERYLQMARGRSRDNGERKTPLRKADWFGTGLKSAVPELPQAPSFRLAWDKAIAETREAADAGFRPKPMLIGPVTFLVRSTQGRRDPLSALPALMPFYRELLRKLTESGAEWIEISEPILSSQPDDGIFRALEFAWSEMRTDSMISRLLLAAPFGSPEKMLPKIAALPADGCHFDMTRFSARETNWLIHHFPRDRVLSVGIIDSRNPLRADIGKQRDLAARLRTGRARENLWIGSSCDLRHAPAVTEDDLRTKPWLADSVRKVRDLTAIAADKASFDACVAACISLRTRRHITATKHAGALSNIAGMWQQPGFTGKTSNA